MRKEELVSTNHSDSRRHFWRRVVGLLTLLALLGTTGYVLLPGRQSEAQVISTPISRHVVLYTTERYRSLVWTPGANNVNPRPFSYYVPCTGQWESRTMTSAYAANAPITGLAYKWGGGDYIDGYPAAGTNDYFLRRLANGHLAGDINANWTICPDGSWYKPTYWGAAGVDCSGLVTRAWGRPTGDKWGTWHIAANSTLVPCRAGDPNCLQVANRDDDLPRRMRTGDVFNDWYAPGGQHVVLLYYFDPRTTPHQPVFYEANWAHNRVRLNEGGWNWLRDNGGWWNGADGYRPYRYNEMRDDLYLPWLAHAWYGWETTLYTRNNNPGARTYATQHTAYAAVGGDQGAITTTTRLRLTPFANDLWELPTALLQPGGFYRGGGAVAADTGSSAVVYLEGSRTAAQTYAGIYPFSSLGLGTATTLYMPAFFYNQGGHYSKIMVQNAGRTQTSVTATYYGDDGRTCSHTVATLQPWGTTITHPEHCPGFGGSPPASGSIKLTASQPLAAITHHYVGSRVDGFNAFSQGGTTLFAPVLLRDYYGWSSTLHVQNVSDSTANNVWVYYYDPGSTTPFCSQQIVGTGVSPQPPPLPANRHTAVNQGAVACLVGHSLSSARIVSWSGQQLVAAVVEDNPGGGSMQSYNTFIGGRFDLVVPFVRRGRHPSWVDDWMSSITVQNASGSPNQVTLSFYDQFGSYVDQRACALGAYASCVIYNDDIPTKPYTTSFSGSVLVHGTQPLVAVPSVVNLDLVDGATSYSALEQKTISTLGGPGAGDTTE